MSFFNFFGRKKNKNEVSISSDGYFYPEKIEDELSEEEKEFTAYQAQRQADLHKTTIHAPITSQLEETSVDSVKPYVPELDLPYYKFPTLELLANSSNDYSKSIVPILDVISSNSFVNCRMELPIALGQNSNNEAVVVDLADLPHLLIAGSTGQGKSACIHSLIASLLYKKHPSQLKFVMIDPKRVELTVYRLIEKHFLAKLPNEEDAIITDTKKVINTLNALCIELDTRYELLKEAGVRNIKEYNEKFIARRLNPEKGHNFLPFMVLLIDEFAELILAAGKEIEMPVARLAQNGRPAGIHLVIATQHPSGRILPNAIKTNFLSRIAFKVPDRAQSLTIIDRGGAELLQSKGEMIFSKGGTGIKVRGAFIDLEAVEKIMDFIGRQRGYAHAFELPEYESEDDNNQRIDLANRDGLFADCAQIVVSTQSGSTSNLQRKLNLGYNRAGRIMDQLEAAGIVGPAKGSKPREVNFKTEYELEQFLDNLI